MSDAAKLYQVWVYLQAEPLFWLTLTIGAYLLADRLYRASGLFPLLNPVAISIILVSTCLINFGVEYERYFDGAKFIHFLLGPATVALSIPIYLNWNIVVGAKKAIVTSVLLGSLFAIGITYAIAVILQLDLVTTKSLLPRNVTAPIAMGISEIIGGVPSLTAIITIVTGIIGAALGTFVLDLFRIKNMAARGFAFGLASHGIGTARAMAKDKEAGVFAAVAMGLSGIVTAAIIPLAFFIIRDFL
ncbi:MAG: LrgB family protein [Candidatus Puniceispirillum sp.]|uniref:LrgB family protein n=1 Tax=uncultured Candidatus Puniceispirillum sp. TaxID=1985115 RepID=UPI002A6DA3AE|nr:LrgB family protein [Candidatus Puniceispirillum sp.]